MNVFEKIMSFTLGDFPKNEVELTQFRSTLVYLKAKMVEDVHSEMGERLHDHLSDMTVEGFPKSVTEHHTFNGQLLNVALGR